MIQREVMRETYVHTNIKKRIIQLVFVVFLLFRAKKSVSRWNIYYGYEYCAQVALVRYTFLTNMNDDL